MHKRLWAHIRFLILWFVLLLLFGALLGQIKAVLLIGVLSYLCWTQVQLARLFIWLQHPDPVAEIPQSAGIWEELFVALYHRQRQHRAMNEQLREQLRRTQLSTNALKEAVVITDARGVMDWWNDAANELLGFHAEIDRGQRIFNLVRDPSFKIYFDRKHFKDPLEINAPGKGQRKLRIHITPFGEGELLIVVQDITRIFKLEQMRRDFVSNVSHELRTPLTVLRGYVETLQDADDLPGKWRRVSDSMALQTKRMELLIDDLLQLSKYETGDQQLKQQSFDIVALLTSICHEAQQYSGEQRHQLNLVCDQPCQLLGDEEQLRSAFSNIILNAVKYTPDGGKIDVHWWLDGRGGHLSVSDTGIGFDPIHIPRLTERFYRVDPSRDSSTGGTGLGLAIVKHVLLNHQAELEIHSQLGKGSRFTCHFPASRFTPLASCGRGEATTPSL